ncbi:hypothetical protein COT78_00110 [Candidatus Berkelbacteria bacterium CG10_big_fil_rev_8_21_14_0_10_43_13]|uniref:Glycosyltransferase RgtA/B/C/D-like domain-containing protein n=1 Tax=Candidatus Berkelbacteria bacterium CG10_big_fil_rev_8_21_14_0_10_43_13 TaxID=1974514 RepID=A0A2H0W7M5_9BACT|nr:MAG: hypothetical protein COT78_00110 [Candidatus Berkelbacteria bacterium CG10_big_fil_rev_8_21_14_0_10_43_13]
MVIGMTLSSFSWLDPDLGWHLYLGQKMVETKSLINHAVGYNYFVNLQIPDHEWLSNLILFQLSRISITAVLALFFVFSLIFSFLLLRIVQKADSSKSTILFSLSIVTLSLTITYGLRLQVLLLLAVALLIYVYLYVDEMRKRMFLYLIIFTLGINLHGGLLTLMPIPILLELKFKKNKKWKIVNIRQLLLIVLLLATTTLLTPYGLRYWQLIFNYSSSTTYLTNIAEWLPIYSFPFHIYNIIFPLSLVLFCLTINNYWKKIPINWVLIYIFYGFLGIRFMRYFPIFMILILFHLALSFKNVQKNVLLNKTPRKILVIFFTILAALFTILSWSENFQTAGGPFSDITYPNKASQFLTKNPIQSGNLFNPYEWGGYLLWKNPDQKVFVDGRGPQTLTGKGNSILDEYLKFNSDSESVIKAQLIKYDISEILLNTTPRKYDWINEQLLRFTQTKKISLQKKPALGEYLKHSQDWQLVYKDNISEIYRRK